MASLNQIANVSISLNTASAGKASFGIPLIVSPVLAFTERLRKYSDYSSAVADGLDEQTLGALSAVFSQTPRPSIAYVGRRDVSKITVTVSGAVTADKNHTIKINNVDFSYTAKTGDSQTEVLQGLSDTIQADSTIKPLFSAISVLENALTFSPISGNTLSVKSEQGTAIHFAGSADITADLSSIKNQDNSWYGFSLSELDDSLTLAAAAWTETQDKLFFSRSNTLNLWSSATDDVGSQLKAKQYLRTVLIADKYADEQYTDAAVMGRFLTKDPGATVFALKNLPSIKVSQFSDTEKGYLIDKNVNTYQQYSSDTYLFGVGTTLKASGRVVSGEWIDVIRDRDWLIDDIQKSIVSIMIRNDKIPYTNAGIALLANTLRARLQNAQTQGVIAPDTLNSLNETVPGFTITYPNAADVDADTKATRILYLSFSGLLAGAIQLVKITGSLSYSVEG